MKKASFVKDVEKFLSKILRFKLGEYFAKLKQNGDKNAYMAFNNSRNYLFGSAF